MSWWCGPPKRLLSLNLKQDHSFAGPDSEIIVGANYNSLTPRGPSNNTVTSGRLTEGKYTKIVSNPRLTFLNRGTPHRDSSFDVCAHRPIDLWSLGSLSGLTQLATEFSFKILRRGLKMCVAFFTLDHPDYALSVASPTPSQPSVVYFILFAI